MPNRLADETSPYLLQHKDNPVDWYPWSDEALARARSEDKPILVSIGYSACHWCHVMEHESFEDPSVAGLMNDRFVNIKIDREERPDLDSIYMSAVQAMTGHGGWPLNVFLTPAGVPFYGGTYFPPDDRMGMPSWPKVLEAVSGTYTTRREDVEESAERIRDYLDRANGATPRPSPLRTEIFDQALAELHQSFDDRNGGFGGAPKFPQASALLALVRIWGRSGDQRARTMLETTLGRMARGGIYDQVGGGFHRYAVDEIWLVPHFEKMLYDNAQLALVYLEAFQAFGDPRWARIAGETLDYVVREMTGPDGRFYATQDADSEGEEGKFYVWTPEELAEVLGGERAAAVGAYYGVRPGGNFEGHTILNVVREGDSYAASLGLDQAAIDEARRQLYDVRARRVWPGRDDKAIAAWNGMMLRAFALGSRVLDRPDFRDVAERNAGFLLSEMRRDGKLLRSTKDGVGKIGGFLEDYANVVDGLLVLHAATLDARWLREALDLAETMVAEFADQGGVGFFDTAASAESLVTRPRDLQDGATPAGNSVAADVLLRIGAMTGDERLTGLAEGILAALARPMADQPLGFGRFLTALDFHLSAPVELALAGPRDEPEMDALLAVAFAGYRPNLLLGYADADDSTLADRVPFLDGRPARNGGPTAYVCERFACLAPVTSAADLSAMLERGDELVWQEI
ncbi:MAG TPA: thioredoxin domain-containing protein [Thermomicrobiales bacterium]|nr:thioredoxin domain-containing protein [Thermomicrobiales bacterium]